MSTAPSPATTPETTTIPHGPIHQTIPGVSSSTDALRMATSSTTEPMPSTAAQLASPVADLAEISDTDSSPSLFDHALGECHFCSDKIRQSDLHPVSHNACSACQPIFGVPLVIPALGNLVWDHAFDVARPYVPLENHRVVQAHYVRVSRSHLREAQQLTSQRRELCRKINILQDQAAADRLHITQLTSRIAELEQRVMLAESLEAERHAEERMKRDVIISTRKALAKIIFEMTPYAEID